MEQVGELIKAPIFRITGLACKQGTAKKERGRRREKGRKTEYGGERERECKGKEMERKRAHCLK